MDLSAMSDLLTAGIGALSLENILYSGLLLVVCLIVIRIVNKVVKRIFEKLNWNPRLEKFIATGIKALLYIVAILIVADSLGVPVTSLVALVSVFGLAISLAVQDVLSNVASGLVILVTHPFELGDYVSNGDCEGTVEEITLTHVRMDTPDGQRIMLPNSTMVAGKIINYTTLGVRRANHAIRVSYDCDMSAVRATCLRAVAATEGVLDDPAPAVVVAACTEYGIEVRVRFWTKADVYWDAHFQSLEELHRCFREDGIAMTYNHVNVHIMDNKEK